MVTLITPCYNEGHTVISFLRQVEKVLCTLPQSFCVVVVDDCSTDQTGLLLHEFRFTAGNISLHIISLAHNCGHQTAIYEGFVYARSLPSDHFVVMDADGQDSPVVIPAMLAHADADIVHVVRNKRSEPFLFRASYHCYKLLFRLATGKEMNFGNFCMISRPLLERAVAQRFTHLAAFLARQQCTTRYITADREQRLGGTSKMGFAKLCRHALHSFSEYGFLFRNSSSRKFS